MVGQHITVSSTCLEESWLAKLRAQKARDWYLFYHDYTISSGASHSRDVKDQEVRYDGNDDSHLAQEAF